MPGVATSSGSYDEPTDSACGVSLLAPGVYACVWKLDHLIPHRRSSTSVRCWYPKLQRVLHRRLLPLWRGVQHNFRFRPYDPAARSASDDHTGHFHCVSRRQLAR